MTQRRSYTLSTFDELAPDIQEKVVNDLRHINVEDVEWDDSVISEWKATLEHDGYLTPRILYSGFGSQGDGACFEAAIDLEAWFKRRKLAAKHRKLVAAYRAGEIEAGVKHTGRYYHAHSVDVYLQYPGTDTTVDQALQDIEPLIQQDVIELSRAIYRALEEEYFALIDDQAVADTIRINDYLFHADGCRAHA